MDEERVHDKSITAENYREHKEIDYNESDQYMRNIDMFNKIEKGKPGQGRILYPGQREMYEFVRNSCIDTVKNHPQYPKFVWKPKICDVGCGGGFGSNILSQEADFVWGIDANRRSIRFAQEVFTRHKNNIYYSPQLTFEVVDIKDEPRELNTFDIVVCIEVIEHIADYNLTLKFLKRLCKKEKNGIPIEPPQGTVVYISSPNRNYKTMGKDHPLNKRHVREWTPAEAYAVLTQHFKYVVLLSQKGEPLELSDTEHSNLFFKCETPIL